MFRQACTFINTILKCITRALCVLFEKRASKDVSPGRGEDWQTDGWEDFSIAVIPSDGITNTQEMISQSDVPDQDVFSDMRPVFKKAKKIYIKKQRDEENKIDFTVQDQLRHDIVRTPGDLGVWNEDCESGQNTWEDELVPDEGNLLQESMAAIKEKRKKERESRRLARDTLKTQQPILGTKAAI